MNQVDLNRYMEFVRAVTSKESDNFDHLQARINELRSENFNPALLFTAAIGLGSEGGEFQEIVKKIFFQGKPVNEENVFHMKRELGDLCWYLAQACMALDTNFDEILSMNYEKLSARYPEGTFDVYRSENRVVGDV